jgi:MFS family permease
LALAFLRKQPIFWLFVLSFFAAVLTLGCLHHMPAHIVDIGFSAGTAALFISVYSFVSIFGKLLLGAVFDRFGMTAGILLAMVSMFFTFVCLLTARSLPMLTAAAVCYGIGNASGTIMGPVIVSKLFGAKHYGENYGLVHAFITFSMGINNFLFAFGYDLTGSYDVSWWMGAGLCVVSAMALLWAVKRCQALAARAAQR